MTARVLILALFATLAAAASAHADAMVFVKRGDVWIARPDGGRAHALTRNGTPRRPYASPSIADDGTIVALKGAKLHSFRPSGRRVVRPRAWGIATPTLSTVPISVDLAPNGRLVATDHALYESFVDPNTNRERPSMLARTTAFDDFRRNRTVGETDSYYEYGLPAWIDGGTVLFTNIGIFGAQVIFAPLGRQSRGADFFQDPDRDPLIGSNNQILSDAEPTRAGDRFAVMRRPLQGASAADPAAGTIVVYAAGSPPSGSTPLCTIGPGRRIDLAPDPSWSPDGGTLFWHEPGVGIFASDAGGCGAPRLVVRGAVQPDLSTATVPVRTGTR